MAADSAKSSGSDADSFIGCFIDLISKAEIRYQGSLFHINPQESTIGLQYVKFVGTEGRRKDGPQILPIDKVYECIFFRGSDIKDLQVLSSPPVQITPDIPNDPAIMQAHYPCSTSPSSSYLSASAAPPINISSSAHSGHPNSISEGILSPDQPVENLRSWDSFPPPPTENGNGIASPTYWPDHIGFSGGVSQMQSPAMNVSLPSDTSTFAQFSHPLLPTVGTSCPYLTFNMPPPSPLPTSVPTIQSATLPPKFSANLMPSNSLNVPPTLTLHPDSQLASPMVTSSLDVNPVLPPAVGRPKSGESSSHLQTAQKDIEVVQGSTSESLSLDSKVIKNPAQPLPSLSAGNLNGAVADSYRTNKNQAKGERNVPNAAAVHTHSNYRCRGRGKGNQITIAVHTHHSYRGRGPGKGNQTFGESPRHRHGRSSRGSGLFGQLQGSHVMSFRPDSILQRESTITPIKNRSVGRGYGQVRGCGRAVWSCVT